MLRNVWGGTPIGPARPGQVRPPAAIHTFYPGENIVSNALEARWRISEQAIANSVADETVILHLGNGTYFGLDPIGARLWEALKAGEAPVMICDTVLAEYEVDRATLEADLCSLLEKLASNDLVEPA